MATLWDFPWVQALQRRTGAKRYKIAMCMQGMEEQKYVEVMLSRALQPAGDDIFSDLFCRHDSHPKMIGGRDDAGRSIAQMSEQYTPMFSDNFCIVLTTHRIPALQRAAEKPQFSGKP